MDETTILSASSCGVKHAIMFTAALTSDEFVRGFVSLAKSQGYCLSNIAESLENILQEVHEEILVTKHG